MLLGAFNTEEITADFEGTPYSVPNALGMRRKIAKAICSEVRSGCPLIGLVCLGGMVALQHEGLCKAEHLIRFRF